MIKNIGELKEAIKDLPDDILVQGYRGGNGDLCPVGCWLQQDEDVPDGPIIFVLSID